MEIVTRREEINIEDNIKRRVESLVSEMIKSFNRRIDKDTHYYNVSERPKHWVSSDGSFKVRDLVLKRLNELLNEHHYTVNSYDSWYVFKYVGK